MKSTGTKLNNLEKLEAVQGFLDVVLNDKTENWSEDEALGFGEIYSELVYKINDCIAPLSNAFYSSVMVYIKDSQYLLHAGANIDPETKEQLKDPVYRNCAEKQAAISALKKDNEGNKNLKVLFLFRKRCDHESFSSEKLIPCKDCYKTYVEDLISNDGKLILIIEDSEPREFLLADYKESKEASKIRSFRTIKGDNINYLVIGSEAMKFLKIEEELGARVCSSSS